MTSNEIRIGNWVQYGNPAHNDLPIFKIEAIWKDLYWLSDGSHISHDNANLTSIPLSEEILLKAGFEKKTYEDIMWLETKWPIIGELCTSSNMEFVFDSDTDTLQIKYVHQLQNLYFALTNTELQINL